MTFKEVHVSRLKRVLTLLSLVATLMLIPLVALAQEGEIVGEEGTQPVNALVTVGFLALVVSMVIERLRKRVPKLDGDLITVIATAIGYAAAWAWGLDVAASFGYEGLPVQLSYLVAALAIASASGFLATTKGAISSRDPNSDVPSPGYGPQ